MKFRKSLICFTIMCTLLSCNYLSVFATDKKSSEVEVEISTDINKEQSSRKFEGLVTVKFHNISNYNESVKLSYHIYDKNNKEIMFENDRIPFELVNGTSQIDFSLNIDDIQGGSALKNCIIRFDLVDEQNGYWYYGNPERSIKTVDLQFNETFMDRVQVKYGYILSSQVVQLSICIIFILIAYIFYKKFKKYE